MGFRQWCAAVDIFSRSTIQVHVGFVVFVVVFVVFVRSAVVFPFCLVVFVGTNKRWINVSGVLRAMVFYVFVVAFWQVVVLSFFVYFIVLPWCFLFFELFSWGQTKRWISASGTEFGASFGLRPRCFVVLFFSRATI